MQSHFIVSILRVEQLQPGLCLLGGCIFVCGMFINIQSDNILKGLRKEGETGYKIPFGGMFRFVSSPNYLGEIIEWLGFALMVQTSAGVWFALFSVIFLGWRGLKTHQWYCDKFKSEYPEDRKAILPLIL